MTTKSENADDEKVIFVNNKEYHVKEDVLLGKEILELAGFDVDKYDLFLVRGQKSERIKDNQQCEIKNGMQFHAILKDVPYG